MRTCDYSDVLDSIAKRAGMSLDQLDAEGFGSFRSFHNDRLQEAWEKEKWPELCPVEQRSFREPYRPDKNYAQGAEVYDPNTNAYYQSLQTNNLGNAPTTGTASTGSVAVNLAWWSLSQNKYSGDPLLTNTAYALGAIVWYQPTLLFYACFNAGTSGASGIDLTLFAPLKPFVRNIDNEQTWPALNSGLPATTPATPIGEFLESTDQDPEVTTRLIYFRPRIDQNGAVYTDMRREFGFVWLRYRLRRPDLTGAAFDATAVYEPSQQMYYTSAAGIGNFYACEVETTAGDTPESEPGKWSLVEIPYLFRRFLIRAGYADWLTSDGQGDKADSEEGKALAALENEADKLFRQQKQTLRLDCAA